jgi:copper chaperone CopZ
MRVLAVWVALLLSSAAPASANTVRFVVTVDGMNCAGCNTKVTDALTELDFVSTVHASFAQQGACAEGPGPLDEAAVEAAMTGLGYTFKSIETVADCPEGLQGKLPRPWATRAAGLDVETISHGETVDLSAHMAAGKYTIIDFGAAWCGPCHDAAETLAGYLRDNDDVAVRVVDLDGRTADESYAQPVVTQHLEFAPGLPWLIAYSPNGKVLARHQTVAKVVAAIDKHRKREAKRKPRVQ